MTEKTIKEICIASVEDCHARKWCEKINKPHNALVKDGKVFACDKKVGYKVYRIGSYDFERCFFNIELLKLYQNYINTLRKYSFEPKLEIVTWDNNLKRFILSDGREIIVSDMDKPEELDEKAVRIIGHENITDFVNVKQDTGDALSAAITAMKSKTDFEKESSSFNPDETLKCNGGNLDMEENEKMELDYDSFEEELSNLLNGYSMENGSNTPDFILAKYLVKCLKTYNKLINRRDKWYGVKLNPDANIITQVDK